MVSLLAVLGLAVVVAVHTVAAAVVTRLFRVRLETRWAPVVFTLVAVPILLFASTLVVSGVLGLGPDLGDPVTAVFVMIGAPLALGMAFDYLWMPAPDEVELPDTA